jgi:hypothetical protein
LLLEALDLTDDLGCAVLRAAPGAPLVALVPLVPLVVPVVPPDVPLEVAPGDPGTAAAAPGSGFAEASIS